MFQRFAVIFLFSIAALGICVWASDAKAQSKSIQRIDVMDGQGLTGYTDVTFDLSPRGDVQVSIDKLVLQYSRGADFNNFDDGYSGADIVGFQSVLRPANENAEAVDISMIEIDGALDEAGNFMCVDCASFTLSDADLRASESWISSIVVGNIIFFNSLRIPSSLLQEP